jgi:hypothetical protein
MTRHAPIDVLQAEEILGHALNVVRETESMTYIARCVCGGAVILIVDDPPDKKNVARHVAAAITDGWSLDRMPTAEVRRIPFCKQRGRCAKKENR